MASNDSTDVTERILEDLERYPQDMLSPDLGKANSGISQKRRQIRRTSMKCSYWKTALGKWHLNPSTRVFNNFEYQRFHRKFRIPCDLFMDVLISQVLHFNIFRENYQYVPTKFKCLAAMCILATGNVAALRIS